ncbi:MAG: acyl-CoA dehydrogenase family protein [Leptospiraceae bacterium]|nr:acyl-CoA dehydrogenase family protein [Leptospiraceae bacterium]
MIQNNYFSDNQDLMLHFDQLIDWNPLVDQYEDGFTDAAEYAKTNDDRLAFAPSTYEEAHEYYRSVLESTGELMGTFVAPRAAEMDKEGLKFADGKVTFPPALNECMEKVREAGVQPYSLGRHFGGLGLPATVQMMCSEISARADASFCLAYGSPNVAEIVERYGSREMVDEWLPKLAAGERACAMALTEPNYGSNLPGVQTRAVEDEDGVWRLTGTKRFITHGCGYENMPSIILTLARTGSPESGARGLSFFLVDGKDVEIAGIETKMGLHCSPTCEVVYDNAPGQLIGKTGYGLIRYSMGMMNTARLTIASQSLGIAVAAHEEARKYAGEREQFGKLIQDIPAVKRMLNRMEREIAAMRCLCVEAARTVDNYLWSKHRKEQAGMSDREINQDKSIKHWEKLADLFTPLSKYYVSETCLQIASDALQIHGGAGYTEEYDVARIYRDARITTIYEGTTQLQVVGAIGGVVAGMNATGNLREYLEREMGAFNVSEETRTLFQKLEESIELYRKLSGETKDALAFEVVQTAARLVMGLLLEKSIQKAGDKAEHRREMAAAFHADSLAMVEANLVRLRLGARAPAAVA